MSISSCTLTSPVVSFILSSLFLGTPLRPPSSILFPYTTLFRSHVGVRALEAAQKLDAGHIRHALIGHDDQRMPEIDRKSTRLNSSHRCISYAVFCLKKKREQGGEMHVVIVPNIDSQAVRRDVLC